MEDIKNEMCQMISEISNEDILMFLFALIEDAHQDAISTLT